MATGFLRYVHIHVLLRSQSTFHILNNHSRGLREAKEVKHALHVWPGQPAAPAWGRLVEQVRWRVGWVPSKPDQAEGGGAEDACHTEKLVTLHEDSKCMQPGAGARSMLCSCSCV